MTTQPISSGQWFNDPIMPDYIRWHDGTKLTGLAGTTSEVFSFIQTTKGNRGMAEPFRDALQTLREPTESDRILIAEKLAELNGEFPVLGSSQQKELWALTSNGGSAIGWKEIAEYPDYLAYWYGYEASGLFLREHVVATNYALPARVAAYIEDLPVPVTPTSNKPEEETYTGPVSSAPAPENPDQTCWIVDPDDSKSMIFWNGDEWSQRRTLKELITSLLHTLGIEMPAAWNIEYSHSRRDLALLEVLLDMNKGPAWVRDPEADFYDLKVRWWDGEQFTDAVGADAPGWYDAPNDTEKLRWWNGLSWDDKFLDKAELQMDADRKAASSAAKKLFVINALMAGVNAYNGTPAERQSAKNAARAADRREWEKGWEDKRQAKRDEAARQQEKFYRKANERRRW